MADALCSDAVADAAWVRRMERNPTAKGRYLVCRASGEIRAMLYGKSVGWDAGREKREVKNDPFRRVVAWRALDVPPAEWHRDAFPSVG